MIYIAVMLKTNAAFSKHPGRPGRCPKEHTIGCTQTKALPIKAVSSCAFLDQNNNKSLELWMEDGERI